MFLSGWFGNSTGSAGPDILVDLLSKFLASRNVSATFPLSFQRRSVLPPDCTGLPILGSFAHFMECTDMDQTTQKPIPKMEISDNCVCAQHLVGGGEVWVCLIELGPSKGLMAARV
jgi:hypothetical protein